MMDAFAETRSDDILQEAAPGSETAPRARVFEALPYLPDAAPDRVVIRAAGFAPLFDLEAVVAAKQQELDALDAAVKPLDALDAIMFGRPIATVLYAADALRWHVGSDIDPARIDRLEGRRAELVGLLRQRIVGLG